MAEIHDGLKVDAALEKEFEKAIAYTLKDEDIERAKLLLGIDVAARCARALLGRDRGCDPQLVARRRRRQPALHGRGRTARRRGGARRSRHGTMVGLVKTPMLGDPMPEEVKQGDQEPVPRHPRLRVRRHVGLVPPDVSRRPDLLASAARRRSRSRSPSSPAAPSSRSAATWRSTSAARSSASTASCASSPSARRRARRASTPRSSRRTTPTRTLRADRRDLRRREGARRREALLGGRERRRRSCSRW